jgi:hypothetical protein
MVKIEYNVYMNLAYLLGCVLMACISLNFMINSFSIFNMVVFILHVVFNIVNFICLVKNIKYCAKVVQENSICNSQDKIDNLQDKNK